MKGILLFGCFVCLLLVLTACSSTNVVYTCPDGTIPPNQEITESSFYVCPNGQVHQDINRCRFEVRASVSMQDAKSKAQEYVKGYVSANGWVPNEPNVYQDEGDWYAQIIVSKRSENSYETTVKVDGERGIASCVQNCPYLS